MQLCHSLRHPSVQAHKRQPLNPPPQRKLYTLHLKEKHHPFVFHIQEEMDTPSSCYLVCFENVTMTKQMIQLIKTHYALHGDWPSTNISPEEPLDLTLPDDAPGVTEASLARVPTIWILSWSETELDDYAKQKRLNLFEIRTDQTVRMYRFEYDLETLQTHLEKSLEI
jgi:hypothetical protein